MEKSLMNSQQIQEQKGRTTIEVINDVFKLEWNKPNVIDKSSISRELAHTLLATNNGKKIKCHPLLIPFIH